MTHRTTLVAFGAGAVVSVAAFVWLLTTHGPLAPVGVETGSAARADLSPSVFGIGTVDARLAYDVGPTSPGRVLRVLVDQGDSVKPGQLLAEMDPVDLDRRVQAAESTKARSRQTLRAADALVAEAGSRAELARVSRDRDQELFRESLISHQAWDNSTHAAEAAQAALVAARANAAAAAQDQGRLEAELRGAGSVRDNLKLVSPVNGVVVSRDAEPGTTVVAGQAVLRLVDPGSLWVRTRVDQSRAQGVRVGQSARIILRSAPDTPTPGRVARVDLQSDPVTEERVVSVSFDQPPDRLYLGELAEVTIHLPGEPGALVVPSAAIVREGSQTGVWQAIDGRARFKPVSIGTQGQPGVTQILSGLTDGERIIVYSSALLVDGIRVREQKAERP